MNEPTDADRFRAGAAAAGALAAAVDRVTIDVDGSIDEDDFFTGDDGTPALASRYDLERAIDPEQRGELREVDRYWVNEPYAFVSIAQAATGGEYRYYLIEPQLSPVERELVDFLAEKLRTIVKYTDADLLDAGPERRREIVRREVRDLLQRYDLHRGTDDGSGDGLLGRVRSLFGGEDAPTESADDDSIVSGVDDVGVRPESATVTDDGTLTDRQVRVLLYYLERDFVGYGRIDGMKRDIHVEDISCDGYGAPVFVYHSEYENTTTNIAYDREELDQFVIRLAQSAGKGISKRDPQVDAILPDGSRAQLTLGQDVSNRGTNYTIREFRDVPYTPVDLINWKTLSLPMAATLWLAIEDGRSVLFGGGTASGKTTTLNAVSLFVPATDKIVSIEDTPEVELPQENWIASITRPGFSEDDASDIDEFDLLEAALRQRPDYIVFGEVRGEEGRTLFQVMSTGHTSLTTFHADSVGEVIKRFTTEPINVSKTLFSSLDLVLMQHQTRTGGRKVRRVRTMTEINGYDDETGVRVTDLYDWDPTTDTHERGAPSELLERIAFDRGWAEGRLERELLEREAVLAYLVESDLTDYAQVATTLQAYMSDRRSLLSLIADDALADRLPTYRNMESIDVAVDTPHESSVPRPDPDEATHRTAREALERAVERGVFDDLGRNASLPEDSTAAIDPEPGNRPGPPDGAHDADATEPRPDGSGASPDRGEER